MCTEAGGGPCSTVRMEIPEVVDQVMGMLAKGEEVHYEEAVSHLQVK